MSSDEEIDQVMELPKAVPKKIQMSRKISPLVKNAIKSTQPSTEPTPILQQQPVVESERYFKKCQGCYNCNWTGYGDSPYCKRDYYN